jgi:predicted Zn-dependent peptidase
VWCGYDLAVGSRNEESGEEGLAHFCEHMTFKGTERRSALQVINDLERVGGELNAFTNKEDTVFYAAVTKDHFMKAVDLLTDIVFHSQYPQHEIDKEVEVICDEIESYNDSPSELIYDEFENLIFQGHPLGHNILGRADLLRTYSTADALRFTHRHYRPDNAVFFVYGDVDFKRLCERFTVYSLRFTDDYTIGRGSEGLAGISSVNCKPSTVNYKPSTVNCKPSTVNKEIGSHQAHVMMGCRAYSSDDKRRVALYFLNNIIGGPGMNSLLNVALREHNGLVYTVESNLTNYTDSSLFSIYFGCDSKDIEKCVRIVRKELDKLMYVGISKTKFEASLKQIKGQIGVACDNFENYALDMAKSYLHYNKFEGIEETFKLLDKLNPEILQDVACDLFKEDNISILVYK